MKKSDAAKLIAKARRIIDSGEHVPCPCQVVKCKEHGKCYECVLMHRIHKLHVPACMQPMLRERITALAHLAEMKFADPTPAPAAPKAPRPKRR